MEGFRNTVNDVSKRKLSQMLTNSPLVVHFNAKIYHVNIMVTSIKCTFFYYLLLPTRDSYIDV